MSSRFRNHLAQEQPWSAVAFTYPAQIPTMISVEERRYLWWLAASTWRDDGDIVEMGPWLGGSTACLAEGIRTRAVSPTHRLHTIDNFVWRSFMSDRADLGLEPGDSFEDRFRANVDPYRDLIVVQRAWLPDEVIPGDVWAEDVRGNGTSGDPFHWCGNPVEIVFVDGAKSWSGLRHLLRVLTPSLIDGSLLVFQDYKYWGSYWVPMMSELLVDGLELVHVLPENTVAFRVSTRLPVERVGPLPDPRTGIELLEQAACRLDGQGDAIGAGIVRLTTVRYLAHCGDFDTAAAFLKWISHGRTASELYPHVIAVRDWLLAFAGRPVRVPGKRVRKAMLRPLLDQARCRIGAGSHRPESASR